MNEAVIRRRVLKSWNLHSSMTNKCSGEKGGLDGDKVCGFVAKGAVVE